MRQTPTAAGGTEEQGSCHHEVLLPAHRPSSLAVEIGTNRGTCDCDGNARSESYGELAPRPVEDQEAFSQDIQANEGVYVLRRMQPLHDNQLLPDVHGARFPRR